MRTGERLSSAVSYDTVEINCRSSYETFFWYYMPESMHKVLLRMHKIVKELKISIS